MTVRPGRPRTFEDREVLDRALEVFWKNGYEATTTRELEEHMGLGQSSIYNAFGSKKGLLLAALTLYEARITDELVDPLERAEQPIDGINGFFDSLAHWVTHDGRKGCMIINLMAEDGGGDTEITERTRSYRQRLRAALAGALTRAGLTDSTAKADILYGLVLGLNIEARGGGSTTDVDRLVQSAHGLITAWTARGRPDLPTGPER